MEDYPLAKLPDEQLKAIVEGGAPIPGEYPLGSPECTNLLVAQNNYLRRVQNDLLRDRNRHLSHIKWIVTCAAALIISGLVYVIYTQVDNRKKVENISAQLASIDNKFTNLNSSVDQLSGRLDRASEDMNGVYSDLQGHLGRSDSNMSIYEDLTKTIVDELKKMRNEMNSQIGATSKELHDIKRDVNDTIERLEGAVDSYRK